jgi:hypothetical protein
MFKFTGKVNNELANQVVQGMIKVCEHFNLEFDATNYTVLRYVLGDLQYDDGHPAYCDGTLTDGSFRKAKVRIVAHDADFKYYANDVNDTHWSTVYKQANKQYTKATI